MWKDFFYFTKTERQGIIVLVVLIIGVFSIPRLVQLFSTPQEVTPEEDEKFKLEYDEFISSIKEIKPQRKFAEGDPPKNDSYSPKEVRLSIFDPNTADSITFISLGLPSCDTVDRLFRIIHGHVICTIRLESFALTSFVRISFLNR